MQKRLITMATRFPEQLHFTNGSLSAILAAQVSHSSMETVRLSTGAAFRWLESGEGRLYLVVMTPQLSYYKIPGRVRRRKRGW
jgi:hypothetical protein